MRVLNVNISIDSKTGGGTAERTYQLTRYLNELGVYCKVLVLDLKGGDTDLILDRDLIVKLKCINQRFYIPKLDVKILKNTVQDVNLIHLMSHWTLLNAFVYIIAKIYKKPFVICPAGALSYTGRSKYLKKTYNCVIGRRILLEAKFCIAISREEVDVLVKHQVDKSKIVHIPNGINKKEYEMYDIGKFKKKYGINNKKVILFVGRLNKIKGVDILFNAFCNICKNYSEYLLIIAGPDEGMRKDLEIKINEKNLSGQIKFIGYLDPKLKSSAYHAAELLVIPSRQEAMSIVVLEAGITGTPSLITNRCGFNEIEKINGGVVVEANISSIQQALTKLMLDEKLLKNMGANMKRYVEKNFLWEIIVKKHEKLFIQVLKA